MSIMNDFKNIIEYLIFQYDLEYDSASARDDDSLFRWIDFKRRHIVPQERETLFSEGFWNKLTKKQKELVHFFCNKVEYGEDINPYQSKGLLKDGLSKLKKTDLLYADWGILHFHLTNAVVQPGSYFSPRSENLSFALVSKDSRTNEESFRCIEVSSHNERNLWSKTRFLKRVAQTWPELMSRFIVSNKPLYNHTHNSKTVKRLRNNNINSGIVINGIEYMSPNLGITAAGTSMSVTRDVAFVKKY